MASKIILASASPRRKELLKYAGLNFTVISPNIDECIKHNESSRDMVSRLAEEKAKAVAIYNADSLVIGADTTVTLRHGDQEKILAKPETKEEAYKMLSELSANTHLVFTAYALIRISDDLRIVKVVESKVTFRTLSDELINNYVQTGEPMDKAGAYGAQGIGAMLISSIEGSYTNVVGLPLSEIVFDLEQINMWQPSLLLGSKNE